MHFYVDIYNVKLKFWYVLQRAYVWMLVAFAILMHVYIHLVDIA